MNKFKIFIATTSILAAAVFVQATEKYPSEVTLFKN